MSKVYLASGRRGRVTRILEATPDMAKETFVRIKARDPKSSIAVFGAKDIDTLKRTQPTLSVAKVIRSVDDFIVHITRTIAKVEPGVRRRSITSGKHKGSAAVRGYHRKLTNKSLYVKELETKPSH
jgi:hypothetical protein